MSDMTSKDFFDRLDELTIYYNNHDDISKGVFLKNKKYWYLYYGAIQYGYVDPLSHNAQLDGSCENRVTFYTEVTFVCKGSKRTIRLGEIADNKFDILKLYAKCLKDIGSATRQLRRLGKTYPELVI